jgi:hypothetical protein
MKYFILILILSLQASASFFIPDGSVTTQKIASGAVTPAKKAALGQQTSGSSSTFSTSSTSATDVSNLTVTITTTGRPVFVGMIHEGGSSVGALAFARNGEQAGAVFLIKRGSTTVTTSQFEAQTINSGGFTAASIPCSSVFYIDTPSSGSYTYKIQTYNEFSGASTSVAVNFCKLIAYEL